MKNKNQALINRLNIIKVFIEKGMKKKVLFAYDNLLHYRIPLFNLLGEKYDFTVLHSGTSKKTENDAYKEVVCPYKKLGPLIFQRGLIKEILNNEYDVIIFNFDVRWVYTILSLYLVNKKTRIVLWGAWLTDSNLANKVRVYFSKKAPANLYYTNVSRNDFVRLGVPKQNTFVANNTFEVTNRVKSYEFDNKFRILTVGSLNSRKQNDKLLEAFNNILDKIPINIILTIIGKGDQKSILEEFVKEKKLSDRVEFIGEINDSDLLSKYYSEAIVSISYGQAGLSILQSFGLGVPYITKVNAISGGEIYNILDGYNSLFCEESIKSLEEKLIHLCTNIDFAKELGKNAYEYYTNYCTIDNMAQGFIDAIENTNESKIDIRN